MVKHGFVPVVEYAVYDNVEDCGGDDISLGDTMFCWEGCSEETALSWDDGVCIPEVVQDSQCVVADTIVLENKECLFVV